MLLSEETVCGGVLRRGQGGGKAQGVEGCWWLGDGVDCTYGQGVYLFEYVDSWGLKTF